MKRIRIVLGLTFLSFLFNGCSLLFVNPPPAGDGPLPEGTCSTGSLIPVVDLSLSAVWGITGIDVYANQGHLFNPDEDAILGAALIVAGTIQGYSAVRGFGWTTNCRKRQAMSEEAIADYLRTVGREGS